MGADDQPEHGLAARLMMMEAGFSKIEARWNRIEMLIILGIVGAILNLVLSASLTSGGAGPHQSTSVITSDASKLASQSARAYLTTADVALREGIAERTVVEYINQGRISPAPEKTGKSWSIAAEYRILPPNAASSGIATLSSSGEEERP